MPFQLWKEPRTGPHAEKKPLEVESERSDVATE